MKNQSPLEKVVFIQKIATFTKTKSVKDLCRLAYVNNSWNDTIKNYAFHLFDARASRIKDTRILEDICDGVIKCGVHWFVDVLIFSQIELGRNNLPRLVCLNATSLAMVQIIFEKIKHTGGSDLLESQMTATVNGDNCLMAACSRSSTPEVLNLIVEKVVEVGGTDLLKSQLTAKNNDGRNCLMCACCNSSSPEVVKLVSRMVVEVGCTALRNGQFVATDKYGRSCLMLCCWNCSSPEVMKLVFEQIVEVGGIELLISQLYATNSGGRSCLMLGCWNSSSIAVMKLLFQKIVEVGGTTLLKSELIATDVYSQSCLMYGCNNSSSSEVVKLIAVVLFYVDLFKQEFAKINSDQKSILKEKANIDSGSWSPDAASLAEVKNLFREVNFSRALHGSADAKKVFRVVRPEYEYI